MGQPYLGAQRPIIAQSGDTLRLVDRGDWFTQDDGREHLDRVAVQWERELAHGIWELVSAPCPWPLKRTRWHESLQSEGQQSLKLGAENAGRRLRAFVQVGYGPSADAGVEYVEWGATAGSHANDLVPVSYSDSLTVRAFDSLPSPVPPTPTQPTLAQARTQMIALAREALRGRSAVDLARVTIALKVLESPDAVWLADGQAIPAAFRDILEPQ